MQTKKKATGRNSARELGSPKVSRHQKEMTDDVQIDEKTVSEIITSSARKPRLDVADSKQGRETVDATNLNARCGMMDDDTSIQCAGNDVAINNVSMDPKDGDETIFSPAFHISRGVGGELTSGADFIKFFQSENDQFRDYGKENLQIDLLNGHESQEKNNHCADHMTSINHTYPVNMELGGGGLSSEVAAIYHSMKNSKLECVDEYDRDQISPHVQMEEDECEEYDEFDPYYFIKNLPELSSVVPTFRPMLLPKQTRSCPPTTLVLDLDETLVHSSLEPCDDADFTFTVNFNLKDHTVYVRCRPHLQDFMERVSSLFEIIIFTASQSIYAEQLLNVLDPKRKIFRHRVYRESCVYVEGNYLKDLSVLGRDLARVVMIDNSPQAFGFQVDNGIPIESWFDDRLDEELISLLPFLESLVGVEDVRPLIAKRFNLRQKIAAAVCPLSPNIGDPFER